LFGFLCFCVVSFGFFFFFFFFFEKMWRVEEVLLIQSKVY